MEVSNAHLHQVAMASLPLEEALIGCPKLQQRRVEEEEEKKKMTTKPEPEQSLKCPRCDSTNTKFCYYNNYSLSQPRYFCKGCRRYWTKGGSLRNVPVGGGCRKSKKSSSSSSSSSFSSSSKRPQDHLHHPHHLPFINPINCTPLLPPLLAYDPNDLSLALASLQQQLLLSGNNNEEGSFLLGNPNHGVYLDMLRTGGLYCGHGDEEVAAVSSLPFGGGATTTTATTVTASASEGGDRELGAGADCRNILGWDAGREHDNCNYWNDGGFLCSKLQSLASSSSLNYSDN